MIKKDILWKSIIEDFFPEVMSFFYPEDGFGSPQIQEIGRRASVGTKAEAVS